MAFPQHISFPAPNAFHRHSLIKPPKTFGRKGSEDLLIRYLYCCGAWRPQPGPRGPVGLDLTYTEEEMSARRGSGECEDARERQWMSTITHRRFTTVPFPLPELPERAWLPPSPPNTSPLALCLLLLSRGSCSSLPAPRTHPASSDTSPASADTSCFLLGLL